MLPRFGGRAISAGSFAMRMVFCWSVTDSLEVAGILDCDVCLQALHDVKALIPSELRGVSEVTPPRRVNGTVWHERTIIDKSLTMEQHLQEAILLQPKVVSGKGVGNVLQAVVGAVASKRESIGPWRTEQRRSIQKIADSLRVPN